MKKLFNFLVKNNLTLSTCESFTAGMFAHIFCLIPGASKIFKGSFVCYTNEFKEDILNISNEIIKKYGVVSKEIANEMVKKCQDLTKSDICFSFTGYAPKTTSPKRGQAFIGVNIKGNVTILNFKNNKINSRLIFQKKAIKFLIKNFWKMI